jgi:hypothetical protein
MELDEQSDRETWERLSAAADAAIDKLTETPTTTIAGMRAAIEYLLDHDGGHYDYLPALLQSAVLRPPVLAG